MAPQPYRLVMQSGPTPGKILELHQDEITIGRDVSNEIVISDPEVSRRHARLVEQREGYVIEDLGSTNGTFVNGQRLMGPHLLRPGEVVMFGENIRLLYESMVYDADATRVAASNVPDLPPSEPVGVYPAEPRRSEPPPPPRYAEPPDMYEPLEEPAPSRTWLYVGCGCLVVLLCVLVGAAVVFDYLNLYCTPPFDALFPCR